MSENINSSVNVNNNNIENGKGAANIEMIMSEQERERKAKSRQILRDYWQHSLIQRRYNYAQYAYRPPKTWDHDALRWIWDGVVIRSEEENIERDNIKYQKAVEKREKARNELDQWLCSDKRKAVLTDDDVQSLMMIEDVLMANLDTVDTSSPFIGHVSADYLQEVGTADLCIPTVPDEIVELMCDINERCECAVKATQSDPYYFPIIPIRDTMYLYHQLLLAEYECMDRERAVDPILRDNLYDDALAECRTDIEQEYLDWQAGQKYDSGHLRYLLDVYDSIKNHIEYSRRNRVQK